MRVPFARLVAHVPEGGWSTVVWAGVGYGDDLEILRAQGTGKAFYLEPNPALAKMLEESSRLGAEATLLRAALWHESDQRVLHVLNDPLHSALERPERLLSARRSLHVTSESLVSTTTLDALCETLDGDVERLLVLDTCGSQARILASTSEPTLSSFACILVRHDPLHADPDARDEVGSRLQASGFESPAESVDAEGTWLLFVRTPAAYPGAPTSLEVDHPNEQELQRIAHLEAAQMQAQQDAERIPELEAALADSLARSEQDAARIAELEAAQVQGQAESAQHVERIAQLESEHGQLQVQAQQDAQRIAQLDAHLQEASQAVRMAVKLQAQREADLEDLQSRYRDGQQALDRQRELLDKLGERLGVASQYFHQLSDASGDETSEESGQAPLPVMDAAGTRGSRATRKPSRGAAKPKSRD